MYEDNTVKQPEQFNFTFNPKEEPEMTEKQNPQSLLQNQIINKQVSAPFNDITSKVASKNTYQKNLQTKMR